MIFYFYFKEFYEVKDMQTLQNILPIAYVNGK